MRSRPLFCDVAQIQSAERAVKSAAYAGDQPMDPVILPRMELAADQLIRATRFGRYEALLRIGRGGMAEVFAGRVRGEAGFQKLVAVKRMLPHLADDEKFGAMFLDEARLAANISSPHVVSTLDLGRSEDGSLYLVMELIIGVTLSSLLRNAAKEGSQIPTGVAVEILAQAAQGLHDAHEARTPAGTPLGIVHRDVSPQNVLVGADGRARITDFGVARAMMRRTDTTTGELKGKLAYFSPEQVADDHIDRRSDVFALGIVSWETFTGRRLFKAENPLALLDRITNMPIPSICKFNEDVPPEVDAVVHRALERDKDKRFASTHDYANALREAARPHMVLPDRTLLTAFVQTAAGDRLRKLEESIRFALDDNRATPPPGGVSSFPDQGSGITKRSGESAPKKSTAQGLPAPPPGHRGTAKWKPSEGSEKPPQPMPDTRLGKRPSAPAGVQVEDDGPAQGSPRRRDVVTRNIDISADGIESERTSLKPVVRLPPEAFGPNRERNMDAARALVQTLSDDDGIENATVQSAPAFNYVSQSADPYHGEADGDSDGVPTVLHPPVHDEPTIISGRERLGLPASKPPSMPVLIDPFGGPSAPAPLPLGVSPSLRSQPGLSPFDAPPPIISSPPPTTAKTITRTIIVVVIVFSLFALLAVGAMAFLKKSPPPEEQTAQPQAATPRPPAEDDEKMRRMMAELDEMRRAMEEDRLATERRLKEQAAREAEERRLAAEEKKQEESTRRIRRPTRAPSSTRRSGEGADTATPTREPAERPPAKEKETKIISDF